jgi:formate dehydrogenase gamma subunit
MSLDLALALWLVAAAPTDADCLGCHGQPDVGSKDGRSVFVDETRHKASVHADVGCTSCHEGITDYPHPERVARPACATCHEEAVAELEKSVHARGASQDTPECVSCHGPAHDIRRSSDPASLVAKGKVADTCASCHASAEFLARHRIPFARPVEAYRLSVHGRAVLEGNTKAPSCADCHGSHGIRAGRDPESKINHWKVPDTCGSCHGEIRDTYAQSVHGEAVRRGVSGAPVCTDCHGEHSILAPSEPQSLVNPARVSSVTCGRCHADERLAERYNLPRDKVPAFSDSYHGLALRAGAQSVANCASCHGVHNILPASDPRSTVHANNLARTCGTCHPGAGTRFAIGPIHVRPAAASEHPVVRFIRVAYLFLIPLTLGFMVLHNLLDFVSKLVRGTRGHGSGAQVVRMNLPFRIAHGLVVLSFPVLVLTGFALTYPEAGWAAPILAWEGRFAVRGWVHRVAGIVLLVSLVYHAIHLALSPRDRAILRHMLPRRVDLTDLWGVFRYNLGLAKERPRFAKFSYAEKMEYWAFLWGSVVMAVSGFLLWFNSFTIRNFPTWVADAATAVHFYEAILATLSILVWHFYMVIFDPDVYPMDRAWLTGRASEEHLRRTRSEQYVDRLRAETPDKPGPPE